MPNSIIRTQLHCLFLLISSLAFSSNNFIYPSLEPSFSNYSTLGLIQTPNARFYKEGTIGLNWTNYDPYLRGALVAYPFSWLEAAYIYTDINNALYSNVAAFSGGQSYKDKGFDTKFRILKESFFLPNIAIGLRDIGGGNTFEAEYLVASKYFWNFDVSLGLGWGDLSHGSYRNPLEFLINGIETRSSENINQGGDINLDRFFRGNVGIFGGIEYFIPRWRGARVKIEYDSTNYSTEAFALGRRSAEFAFEPVKQTSSRINIGFVYPIKDNFVLKASFVKGHTLSFGFSYKINASKNNLVKKDDPIQEVENAEQYKEVASRENINFYRILLNRMNERELNLQHANLTDTTASVIFTQSKYISHSKALGRALRVMHAITPDHIQELEVININSNLGMYSAKINRRSFDQNLETNYYPLVYRSSELKGYKYDKNSMEYNPKQAFPSHHYYISPYLRTQIGGPEGFFFGDLRVGFESEIQIRRGTSIFTQAGLGITSNMDELNNPSDSILPHVRTDIIKYLKGSEHGQIDRMNITQFYNPKAGHFLKFQAGILEPMFSGFGSEYLFKPFDKDFALGAEIWKVKQRAYDMRFDHLDYETITGHINLYYQEPKSKVLFTIRGGRFLAKDSGINFNFSRRFKNGFTVGAFFAKTDISAKEFGEGSFDKGFYFFLPFDLLSNKYSKRIVPWGLRPITRDGAAFLEHSYNLFSVAEQANYEALERDFDELYD